MAQKRESGKLVAENRKARFNFAIEDTLESGLVLTGSEVKSLRAGKANIGDAYASDEGGGALYLINAHIAEYTQSGRNTHAPTRPRKLHFSQRGLAKVLLGLAKGKKLHDKRETEKKRDWDRQKGRLMRDKG